MSPYGRASSGVPPLATGRAPVRLGVRVRGAVQAVGFRPAVYRLARSLGLAGCVRNDALGVWIEVEGDPPWLERFMAALPSAAPSVARIDALEAHPLPPLCETAFRIEESPAVAPGEIVAAIPADLAPCDACLAELSDPVDRRHRYPFLNCAACGPRYSLVRELPYDRARTTMDAFPMCERCRREYEDPADRRFHAEPTACPACGPHLAFLAPRRRPQRGEAALAAAARALRCGAIVAVKGVGGYLLCCDAADEGAVARLRARKLRPHKPFAVMVRDLSVAERIAEIGAAARAALASRARPIVLVPARADAPVAAGVAPGLGQLGLFLPPSPLQHLLLSDGPAVQVVTSGNRAEEPIACDDRDALRRLRGIADAFLVHDRAIHARVDDSVVRIVAGAPQPIRRARGFVPEPVRLAFEAPPVLGVGGQQKNTVCLTRGDEAFLSAHVGDLTVPEARAAFCETIEKLARLLGVAPRVVGHDLHPDYASTRWALATGLPRVPVQHHHAHIAACLAEHGRIGPVIGVAFDGTGCGPGGELWGGEILLVDLESFQRLGHLWPIPLPGGEAAIRSPWRLAVAALVVAGATPEEEDRLLGRIASDRRAAVRRLVLAKTRAPLATGAGRWFDAVAALCAVRDEITYEGQAAVELEAIAAPGEAEPYPLAIEGDGPTGPFALDLRPAVRALAAELLAGVAAASVAARFHETLARLCAAACRRAREATGVATVALSGGCFQNARLAERAAALLCGDGFEVLLHRVVPPNDGGLSLGQAVVAAFFARRDAGRGVPDVPRHPR